MFKHQGAEDLIKMPLVLTLYLRHPHIKHTDTKQLAASKTVFVCCSGHYSPCNVSVQLTEILITVTHHNINGFSTIHRFRIRHPSLNGTAIHHSVFLSLGS